MVQLSQLQDSEVGDGTTSVVLIAAELLQKALEMIRKQIHPSTIISGYKTALKHSVNFIKERLMLKVDELGEEGLINVAKTSMSSKFISGENEKFSSMAVKAMQHVKTQSGKHPVRNVHIIKAHGQSTLESEFFPGFVLRMSRVSQQMPLKVENPKIACLDFNLSKFRLAMGIKIEVTDPKNLDKIRAFEIGILKSRLLKIIKAGATVVFTTQGMDDIASKFLVGKQIMGLRRVDKKDLRRIALSTGAKVIKTMANESGEESFEPSFLGTAECVYEENLGDVDYIFLKNSKAKKKRVCTLILRGSNEFLLDEVERSLHDTLCVLKRTFESRRVVVGGGCVETALCVYLEKLAQKQGSKE